MSAGIEVVGLDLSITATGIASSEGTDLWKLAARLGDDRLRTIAANVKRTCLHSDLVVIEDLPTHAHGAGITGMVHGAARVALRQIGVEYVLVTPATLKKFATGKGNADKTAMAMAAYKRADAEFPDDNQCDAWWLRMAGLTAYGASQFSLPEAQLAALSKVAWPRLGRYAPVVAP